MHSMRKTLPLAAVLLGFTAGIAPAAVADSSPNGNNGSFVAPGRQTNIYSFNGNAGDQIQINVSQASGIYERLYDPYGNLVLNQSLSTNSTPLTLLVGGTYTLLIEGNVGNTGPAGFHFTLTNTGTTTISPLTGTAMSLGTAVNGKFSTGGEIDDYVFTISAPVRPAKQKRAASRIALRR